MNLRLLPLLLSAAAGVVRRERRQNRELAEARRDPARLHGFISEWCVDRKGS